MRLAMLTAGEDTEPIIERTKYYVDDVVTHSGHYSEGMGTLRNKLLFKAREGMEPEDYILMLDPDEIPSVELDVDKLTEPLYSVTYHGGGETWNKPTFLRADTPAIWKRSVHEYLDTVTAPVHLDGFIVEQPFSSSNPERRRWKVDQLLSETHDPRSVYYLAQEYKCLELRGESLRWYLARSKMGDYEEERWHALYMAACIAEDFDYDFAASLFERAIKERPSRPEGYYRLARLHDFFGNHELAWATAQTGAEQEISTDELFVDRWAEGRLKEMATHPVGHIFDGQHA
jgi:hypothetical protein